MCEVWVLKGSVGIHSSKYFGYLMHLLIHQRRKSFFAYSGPQHKIHTVKWSHSLVKVYEGWTRFKKQFCSRPFISGAMLRPAWQNQQTFPGLGLLKISHGRKTYVPDFAIWKGQTTGKYLIKTYRHALGKLLVRNGGDDLSPDQFTQPYEKAPEPLRDREWSTAESRSAKLHNDEL